MLEYFLLWRRLLHLCRLETIHSHSPLNSSPQSRSYIIDDKTESLKQLAQVHPQTSTSCTKKKKNSHWKPTTPHSVRYQFPSICSFWIFRAWLVFSSNIWHRVLIFNVLNGEVLSNLTWISNTIHLSHQPCLFLHVPFQPEGMFLFSQKAGGLCDSTPGWGLDSDGMGSNPRSEWLWLSDP